MASGLSCGMVGPLWAPPRRRQPGVVGEGGWSADEPPAASANRHAGGDDFVSALAADVAEVVESLGLSMRRTKAGTLGLDKLAGGRGAEAAPLGAAEEAKSNGRPVAKSTVASEARTCNA